MSADVALVTWRELPELDPDDRPLAVALRGRGHEVAIVAWDDPGFDWPAARLVVLRNPWDYYRRFDEFMAWATRVEAATSGRGNHAPTGASRIFSSRLRLRG